MTARSVIVSLTVFLFLAASPASAQDGIIGSIVEIEGSATLVPAGGTAAPAMADAPLHMEDTVRTGPDSRVFVLFIDNTELILSADTEVKIDDYVFDPESQANSARYSILRGAFQYVSGLIGKQETPDVEIETPVGSIGIRGTDFWAGTIDGEYGVAVAEGRVALKTDGGEAIINKGEGASVRDRRSRPSPAKVWERKKLDRVAGTVNLKRKALVRQRIGALQGRQKTLQGQYKNFMKAHRAGGKWQKQQRRLENKLEKNKPGMDRGGQLQKEEEIRKESRQEFQQKVLEKKGAARQGELRQPQQQQKAQELRRDFRRDAPRAKPAVRKAVRPAGAGDRRR